VLCCCWDTDKDTLTVLRDAHQRSCVDEGFSGEIVKVEHAASADSVDEVVEVDDKGLSGEYTVRGAPCLLLIFYSSTQRRDREAAFESELITLQQVLQ
jgi:hypothetical protein